MASVAPMQSRMPRSGLLFRYQSAPVWHFGFSWVIFDTSKNAGLSEPGHFPEQGAGDSMRPFPFSVWEQQQSSPLLHTLNLSEGTVMVIQLQVFP